VRARKEKKKKRLHQPSDEPHGGMEEKRLTSEYHEGKSPSFVKAMANSYASSFLPSLANLFGLSSLELKEERDGMQGGQGFSWPSTESNEGR
jgi:hypothetical protein